MSIVNNAYKEWLNRNDRIIEKDNYTYYRIVWSECFKFSFKEEESLFAVLSPDMPKGKYFEDENGNHFKFDGFHFIRFIGEIPEWYLKAGECSLKWVETKEIGKYLRVIE